MKKNSVKIILFVLIVIVSLTALLGGCDLARKIQGVEVKFQQKIQKATQLSFDMHLTIQDQEGTDEIDVSCYKKGNEYAYTFVQPDDASIRYRRLFAEEKLYEYLTKTTLHIGSYYVNDDVAYTDERNILYAVNQNIMLATYATLITVGKKETINGVDTYRYDFTKDGNQYSLWYDDENLVKILAVFNTTDEDGNKTSETYSALFSKYRFDGVATEPFLRPT
ncbi:MAG: hypothetical protein IJ735_02105, partial [Clostridia bacterium]|nr:hypothetical protein [Clostridia bacterium]